MEAQFSKEQARVPKAWAGIPDETKHEPIEAACFPTRATRYLLVSPRIPKEDTRPLLG